MKKIKEYLSLFFSYTRSHKDKKTEINFKARDLAFLIPHTKKYIPRYMGLFFILILSSGLSLPGPAITGYIIDNVFVSKNASQLAQNEHKVNLNIEVVRLSRPNLSLF